MRYKQLIEKGLRENNLSLGEAAMLISQKSGISADRSYLSKLKSGAKPPASDKLNDVIADVLSIDPLKLKVAAYREKIPLDVLEMLCNQHIS